MGFKPGCCWGLGFFSFIGAIFYGIAAFMVYHRNYVFLAHKAGMDIFNSTEEQYNAKMMAMLYTSAVSK